MQNKNLRLPVLVFVQPLLVISFFVAPASVLAIDEKPAARDANLLEESIKENKELAIQNQQNRQYKQALVYTEAWLNLLSKSNNKFEQSQAQEMLSQLYCKLDDAARTISWGKAAIDSMLIAKGATSAEYAQSLLKYSSALKTIKELDEAEKLTLQSIQILRKSKSYDELILALLFLGQIKHETGDYKNAIACFNEAMQLNELNTKTPERKEMRNITCWKHLAESCEKAQQWQTAELYWKKLIEWKIQNGKDPDYYRTMLAFCYGHEGKLKDADETFSEILQQKRDENDNSKLATYLDWYVRYLESTGRPKEADRARKELNLVRAR